MVLPLIGWGAAALGATAYGGALAFKDELGIGVDAAAREELRQGKDGGYDKGEITRKPGESLRDFFMLNSNEAIRDRARVLRVQDIEDTLGKQIKSTNANLVEVGADGSLSKDLRIKPTYKDTVEGIRSDIQVLTPKIERTAQGQADAPNAGITMDTPAGQISAKSRSGIREEDNLAILESPIYQEQLRRQNFMEQRALDQMALSELRTSNQFQIAMMDNQLERRRQDMQERSNDRKDRQQMILMLMKGLSNIGQSIAI